MQQYLLLLALFIITKLTGQEEVVTVQINDNNINSLVYTIDSVEELETINWDDIKEIFSENRGKDSITIGCRIKAKPLKDDCKKYVHSFRVKGTSEDIDGTINIAKRITKAIQKL